MLLSPVLNATVLMAFASMASRITPLTLPSTRMTANEVFPEIALYMYVSPHMKTFPDGGTITVVDRRMVESTYEVLEVVAALKLLAFAEAIDVDLYVAETVAPVVVTFPPASTPSWSDEPAV